MAIHSIKCDQCEHPMLFQKGEGRMQAYRCFDCANRWAIVNLNSQGGVNSIAHLNERDANMRLMFYEAGRALGKRH
jgi:transposase-like protein